MTHIRIAFALLLLAVMSAAGAKTKKSKDKDGKANAAPAATAPKWTTDEGRLEVFPLARYVSASASGATAEEARGKAAGIISGIIKSNVQNITRSQWNMSEGSGGFQSGRNIEGSAVVSSDNELYQLEYTTPYYDERQGCYECAAYIDRVKAFNFVRPRLEKGSKVFTAEYQKAQDIKGEFERTAAIRQSWNALKGFYEVYDFARAVCPALAARYESVDLLAEQSRASVSSGVQIAVASEGDDDGMVKAAVEKTLGKHGFAVVKSGGADYTAQVSVTARVQKAEKVFVCYPVATVEVRHGEETVSSYTTQTGKAAGFDEETAERNALKAVAKDIEEKWLVSD